MKVCLRTVVLLWLAATLVVPARAADPASDQARTEQVVDAYITVMTMAYPPAGAALAAAKGLMDMLGFFDKPDLVGEAIQRINRRLDELEQRVNTLESRVQQLQNELLRTQNLERIRQLRAHRRALQGVMVRLQQRPTDRVTKVALAHDAQVVAEDFMVDLWFWSDMALKDHRWGETSVRAGTMLPPDFKPMPALEYYTAALVTWMAAIEYASDGNREWVKQTYGSELQRHIHFLTVRPGWNELQSPGETLPEQIRTRVSGQYIPQKYPENRVCYIGEYVKDSMAREIRYVQSLTYNTATNNELCNVPQGLLTRATAREEELEDAYGTGLMAMLASALTRVRTTGTSRRSIAETTPLLPPPGPGIRFAVLYGIDPAGAVRWYRHDSNTDGSASNVLGPRDMALNWSAYKQVIPGGGDVLYGLAADGTLHWFRHAAYQIGLPMGGRMTADASMGSMGSVGSLGSEGPPLFPHFPYSPYSPAEGARSLGSTVYAAAPGVIVTPRRRIPDILRVPTRPEQPAWEGPKVVGCGWGVFKHVFSGSDGVVYAITADGRLLWYRHLGYRSGGGVETWQGPTQVGTGWGHFLNVVSQGDGVIYGVQPDGALTWYKHLGYLDGRPVWEGPKNVDTGWAAYKQIAPAGSGEFYVVEADGTLRWLRHKNYLTGGVAGPDVAEAGRPEVLYTAVGPRVLERPDVLRRVPNIAVLMRWESRVVGTGWGGFRSVVALIPRAPDPVR